MILLLLSSKMILDIIGRVGMKNFIRIEKVFKCLKRKKLCEEERFYNLEEDFLLLESFLQTWLLLGDTK